MFITAIILILLAGLLQNTELPSFYGVKINLVLVLLLTLSFFISDPRYYLVLALEGALLLKVSPGLDAQTIALLLLALSAFYLKKYLAWQPALSNVFLIAAATILFYIPVDFNFVIYNTPVLILEAIYNTLGGLVLYFALEKIYAS